MPYTCTCGQGIPLFTESHREALLSGDGIDAVAQKSAFFRQHVKGGGERGKLLSLARKWGRMGGKDREGGIASFLRELESGRRGRERRRVSGCVSLHPHHRLFSSVARPYSEKIKGGKKGFGHAKDKRAAVVPM